jgi:hypothetical protein
MVNSKMIPSLILGVIIFAAVGFGLYFLRFSSSPKHQSYSTKDIYLEMRNRAFTTKADKIGLQSDTLEPYGIIVETGLQNGISTVVIYKTGDASMYFSSGGGYIGGIGHEEIRNAVSKTIEKTQDQIPRMKPTNEYPLVERGQVRVYALTPSGLFYDESTESAVFDSDSAARVIFSEIQDVITGFRHIDEIRNVSKQ